MFSRRLNRFKASMQIGYDQWHDGVGYDLDAIDRMSPAEKRSAEQLLIPRAGNDWRDLEALDRLGTPAAWAAIVAARQSESHEIRLLAHQYGPPPSEAQWGEAILYSLEKAEIYSGLTNVLKCATQHPSVAVKTVLWEKVRTGGGIAYHCAATLCCIAGVIESEYSDQYRSLFLRLVAVESDDRTAALAELHQLVGD